MKTEHQKRNTVKADVLIAIGLSVFIMLVGIVELIPEKYLPAGTLFIISGLILLLVSCIIEIKKLDHVGFQIILAFILLLNGLNYMFSLNIKVMPAFLVVIGFAYFYSLVMDKVRNKKDDIDAYEKAKAGKSP